MQLTLRGEGKCRTLTLFKLWILFSYQTPVAFYSFTNEKLMRRQNEWGPTTGKHINQFLKEYLTIGNLQTLEEQEFNEILYQEMHREVMINVARKTQGEALQ